LTRKTLAKTSVRTARTPSDLGDVIKWSDATGKREEKKEDLGGLR
jgi:hypothetical protein